MISIMRALSVMHDGRVAVTFTPAGTGAGSGVTITAGIIFERLPGSELPGGCTVDVVWPSEEHRSFFGAVYNSLWILDHAIEEQHNEGAVFK
jgi:hypothetical protein